VIIPLHPRGRAAFAGAGLADHPRIRIVDPLGYLDFMSLVRGAAAAITDSAGVQEETTFLRVPCLTLRPVTERPVTVTSGSADHEVVGPVVGKVVPELAAVSEEPRCGEVAVEDADGVG
jgi:UDP-N-acetylglucosamine 2-epimerase (non-hydrolysing)